MPSIPSRLHTGRILLFLAITFAFSWLVGAYLFLTGGLGDGVVRTSSLTALMVVYMFGPAIGHLGTRLLTSLPVDRDAMWLRLHLRGRLRWYVVAWFLPAILTLAGVGIYYLLFPQHFDLSMGAIQRFYSGQLPADATPASIAWSQLVAALTFGPAINTFVALGEEFGWRGFLLQHLYPLGEREAVVLTGVIWGIWHWPLIGMGYNYGFAYPLAPWLGMLAMGWLTILLGTLLAWVAIRSGSVWPAAVGHGAFNAIAGFGLLFVRGQPNTLLGPLATGVVVSIPMLGLAGYLLRRRDAFEPNEDTEVVGASFSNGL